MGTREVSGGSNSISYWVPKGQEAVVWFGSKHLEPMKKSDFEEQSRTSTTKMSGAQGVWGGMPVNVVYVPHEENKDTPISSGLPRFQFKDGVDQTGAIIGNGGEIEDDPKWSMLKIHDNIVIIMSRCTHLCCIPGWQLVANDFTADNWLPGGLDAGGNKLFCICHSSRFDPTTIEKNTNINKSTGAAFKFFGIKRTGGPAPVGIPLIPFKINNDILEVIDFEAEGVVEILDWYTYCN
jgi:Rieske Fe-S protein